MDNVKRTFARALAAAAVTVGLAGVVAMAADPKSYGKGVSIKEATPLTAVLATPAKYEGKTVRVEGYVTSVCEEMGCWLALAPTQAKGAPTLLIQVEHGVVVFPMSARGSRAAAEGVLQRIGAAPAHGAEAHGTGHGGAHGDHAHEAAAEHAKAEGKSAADASQWHIMATGAEVYN